MLRSRITFFACQLRKHALVSGQLAPPLPTLQPASKGCPPPPPLFSPSQKLVLILSGKLQKLAPTFMSTLKVPPPPPPHFPVHSYASVSF